MFFEENYLPLKEAAERISGHNPLAEELLHYTIDQFLQKPDVESIVKSGGGRWYCVSIMMNQWRSVTSPFFHTYRKSSDSLDEMEELIDESPEDLEEFKASVERQLQTLPWYDRLLFQTYVEESHSVSSLARATGIPRTSVSLTLNRVRKHIRKNL